MWKAKQLPQFISKLRTLVGEHRKLKDEPLHLAVAYHPNRKGMKNDIFMLEVIGGLEGSSLTPDPELFEITFQSTPEHDIGFDRTLHLILTNESELRESVENEWVNAREFANAMSKKEFEVIYADEIGKGVLKAVIELNALNQEAVNG